MRFRERHRAIPGRPVQLFLPWILATALLAGFGGSWSLSPAVAAQEDDELIDRARAATLTQDDLGPSWMLLVENAGSVADPRAGHYTSVYGNETAGPESSGVLAAGSAAFVTATPMPPGFADSFRPGFFTGFASTSGVPADAFAEVEGPLVNGTVARWYVAEVPDPPLVFHVVFVEQPDSIGVVFGTGNSGRLSQADVLPLAQTVADRLRWVSGVGG